MQISCTKRKFDSPYPLYGNPDMNPERPYNDLYKPIRRLVSTSSDSGIKLFKEGYTYY